jgi:uncharacterized integral membrane protein
VKLLGWVIAVPVGLIVIAFAVANREAVEVRFDPLPYAVEIPIYAVALGAIIFGFVVGAVIRWLFDHRWRRLARLRGRRIRALERESDRLRERLERDLDTGLAAEPLSRAAAGASSLPPPQDAA